MQFYDISLILSLLAFKVLKSVTFSKMHSLWNTFLWVKSSFLGFLQETNGAVKTKFYVIWDESSFS